MRWRRLERRSAAREVRAPARLCVTAAGFALIDRRDVLTVALAEIAGITAYKRDMLTTDMVCWEIFLGDDDRARSILIHEDMPGFDAVAAACARLPGFQTDWRAVVIPVAFAPSVTRIYRRCPGPPS